MIGNVILSKEISIWLEINARNTNEELTNYDIFGQSNIFLGQFMPSHLRLKSTHLKMSPFLNRVR